jgi:hypothetical protein
VPLYDGKKDQNLPAAPEALLVTLVAGIVPLTGSR